MRKQKDNTKRKQDKQNSFSYIYQNIDSGPSTIQQHIT